MQYARDFRTRSLYVAATLIAVGVPYLGLEDGPDGGARFRFDNEDNQAHAACHGYTSRTMENPPQPATVIDALFQLRNEIRSVTGR